MLGFDVCALLGEFSGEGFVLGFDVCALLGEFSGEGFVLGFDVCALLGEFSGERSVLRFNVCTLLFDLGNKGRSLLFELGFKLCSLLFETGFDICALLFELRAERFVLGLHLSPLRSDLFFERFDVVDIGCDLLGLQLHCLAPLRNLERFGIDGFAFSVEFCAEPFQLGALNLYSAIERFLAGRRFSDKC